MFWLFAVDSVVLSWVPADVPLLSAIDAALDAVAASVPADTPLLSAVAAAVPALTALLSAVDALAVAVLIRVDCDVF